MSKKGTVRIQQFKGTIGCTTKQKEALRGLGLRRINHVVEREDAKIGVFVTLAEPTKPMTTEAVKAGFYETEYGKYPKLQILTIEDLFADKRPAIPLVDPSMFRRAATEKTGKQTDLFPN